MVGGDPVEHHTSDRKAMLSMATRTSRHHPAASSTVRVFLGHREGASRRSSHSETGASTLAFNPAKRAHSSDRSASRSTRLDLDPAVVGCPRVRKPDHNPAAQGIPGWRRQGRGRQGTKVSDLQIGSPNITPGTFHGVWNYTIAPMAAVRMDA